MASPAGPKACLSLRFELLGVERTPSPPKVPRDVKRPPRRAKTTPGGVRYRYLRRAKKSAQKATEQDTVEVHYTGWTTDGKMFDSSISRGRSATFPLTRVIKGWSEGVSVMRVGDKVRMWIPEELAYKGRPGAPQGMLVFDVELLSIKPPPPPPTP